MNKWYSFQTDSCRSVNFDSDVAVLKCNVGQKRGERTNNLGVVIKKEIQTNKNEWVNQSVLRANKNILKSNSFISLGGLT